MNRAADHETDVVVIGAGQAGLSAAYFLRRAGLDFAVLDHGKRAGGAWQYRWPSLRLGKVHGIHDLPGLPLGTPDGDRPAAEVVSEYFDRYERAFDLPVLRPVDVRSVRRSEDGRLLVDSATETWAARAVINATGPGTVHSGRTTQARTASPEGNRTPPTTPAPPSSAASTSWWSAAAPPRSNCSPRSPPRANRPVRPG
ncbi:hypothetical protein GCM10027521_10010 [Amycolatopsis cihanbeyliensis]